MGRPFVGIYPITCGKYYSDGAPHIALDYGCPIGTEVLSVGTGIVGAISDGVSNNKPGYNPGPNAPSNWIMIYTEYEGKDAYVYYQHLSPGLKVQKNDRITDGQYIAKSGNSGNTTGPHLHIATGWGHPSPVNRYQYMKDEFMIYPPTLLYVPKGWDPDVPDYMSVSKSTDFDLKVADDWKTLYFDSEVSDDTDQHGDGNYPTILVASCYFDATFNMAVAHKFPAADLKNCSLLTRFVKYNDDDKTISPFNYLETPLIGENSATIFSQVGANNDGQRLRIQSKLSVPAGSPITHITVTDYDCRLLFWLK